jgi:hypothetical protein
VLGAHCSGQEHRQPPGRAGRPAVKEYAFIITVLFPNLNTYLRSSGIVEDNIGMDENDLFKYVYKTELDKMNERKGTDVDIDQGVTLFYRLAEN